MRVHLFTFIAAICFSVSYSAVINESPQKDLLEYETRVHILQRLLKADCDISNNVSTLLTDDRDVLKLQYQRMVRQLSDCHKDQAKQAATGKLLKSGCCLSKNWHHLFRFISSKLACFSV